MLTALNVSYPLAPVGPDAVGGAEQVVTTLDRALVRAGHRSIVIACAGSRVAGTLIELPAPDPPFTASTHAQAQAAVRAAIARALEEWRIDVIHLHGVDFDAYLPPAGPPVLVTLHLPPEFYRAAALRPERADTYFHCVSCVQHDRWPTSLPLLPPIDNGVAVDRLWRRDVRRRDFALALSRICPEKGLEVALDAARAADTPLVIAGRVFPFAEHERYFRDEIVPRLDERRRFVGPAGLARKRRLLSAARCLLVSSRVSETSSLVAMEALACGTPVIASPVGMLEHIVQDGRTGFLVSGATEMAQAIARVSDIDAAACIASARTRFAEGAMTDAYLQRYAGIARPRALLK